MADKVHRLEDTQPSLTLGDVMVLLVGNDRAQEVLERMKRGIVRGMGNIAQEIVRSALQPVPASPVQPGRGPAILRQPTSTRLQGEIDELRGLGDAQRIQALQELVTREVDKLPQEHRAAFLANMYRQLAPTAEQTGSGLSVVRFDLIHRGEVGENPPIPGQSNATWKDTFDWYYRVPRYKCPNLIALAELITMEYGTVRNQHRRYTAQYGEQPKGKNG